MNIHRILFWVTLFPFVPMISTGQNLYDASTIPAAILLHANVVKRAEVMSVVVKPGAGAIIHHQYALTIINAQGDASASFLEYYNKLRTLQSIQGYLYDGHGKKIKTLSKSDIQDLSGGSGSTFVDDYRLKKHNFNWKVYPYTIEYDYISELKSTFLLPDWSPMEDEKYAVEHSSLTVDCPADYHLRYHSINYPTAPSTQTVKEITHYGWRVDNLPPMIMEKLAPDWSELTPSVFLAPSSFTFEQYSGNMETWQGFGKFIGELNAGRDQLPEIIQQKVHELTDKVLNPREKIALLYEFLQKNTRYVGIQIGIGGWQPFDAKYVGTKGYGDCKALTNYMHSLLKEVGISSYPAMIFAGNGKNIRLVEFPSNQFNHVILCIPQARDSIWLECTSQTLKMGYLSGFTSDRYALLMDNSGGKIIKTPRYREADNLRGRVVEARVDGSGELTALIHTRYWAERQDDLHEMLQFESKTEQEDRVRTKLNLPAYEVQEFKYTTENTGLPLVREMLKLSAKNYASVSNKRIFFNPNILSKSALKLPTTSARKFDIKVPLGFTDLDTVTLALPAGYQVESLPSTKVIKTKFGSYETRVQLHGNTLTYWRALERKAGRYASCDAVSLAQFYSDVYDADREDMVLVKKE